jgi:hypothetical protein
LNTLADLAEQNHPALEKQLSGKHSSATGAMSKFVLVVFGISAEYVTNTVTTSEVNKSHYYASFETIRKLLHPHIVGHDFLPYVPDLI